MRLRNVPNAIEDIKKSKYTINDPKKYKSSFKEVFKNDNPLHIEIGMGKGDFIIGMAANYPDINFIGIEKYPSVQIRAIKKAEELDLPNLRFISMDALDIDDVFSNDVDILYLNFSDPWPKTRHEKRRLTSPLFLEKYDSIFAGNPHIIQKTDNIGLFAYSLSSLSKNGYTLNKVSLDLESEDIFNICTEYEKKFMNLGVKINYLDAVKYIKK